MKNVTDEHGQPINSGYNARRVNDRTIDELIGVVKGVAADGKVNLLEAQFLLSWMTRNAKYSSDKIVNLLYSRIKEMLADNILDLDEQKELMEILRDISGEHCPADQAEVTAATFPLNKPTPVLDIPQSTFCFTGKFAYGPRKECEKVITNLGGIVKNTISHFTDYLVIGTLSSSEWIHTSYGRKIEKAMDLRDNPPFQRRGKPPVRIIHEDLWANYALRQEPPESTRPEKKRRLSIPGKMFHVGEGTKIASDKLEKALVEIETNLLNKGWCVFHRNSHLGLAGYTANVSKFIPEKDRKQSSYYQNFVSKDGEPKTREYVPREDTIVSISKIIRVGSNGEKSSPEWEVMTYWTGKRNIFSEFDDAWKIFLEIEARYDPGKIIWTKLAEYEEFEPY